MVLNKAKQLKSHRDGKAIEAYVVGIEGDEMRYIISLGLILLIAVSCAPPQVVKDASRNQGDLLREFQKTLGDLRTKLLQFYDEEIEEFRQSLLKSRMAFEQRRIAQRADEAIRAIDSGLPEEQRVAEVKKILDAAANYLAELPGFYFEEEYCKVWGELKPAFLREPNERCHDDHGKQYRKLLAAREEVAIRFDRVVKAVATTREAHDLVNEFVQIEFRLTEERVTEAKEVIEEARKTIEEAKETWAKLRTKEEGSQ